MYESRNIYVKPAADQSDNIKLTYAEYFFDTDPGNGSATAFPAFTAADSIDQTQTPSITSLTAGSHTLNIRVRNSLGLYSIAESRSFDICSAFPTANFTYDEVCTGTPTTFTNATTGSDNSTMYKWDIKADGTIESTNKDTTQYNLTAETNVKLIAYNSQKCSDTVIIAVPVKPTPDMPAITKYGADSLSASLSGVTYNWYLNGNTLDLHTKNIKPAAAGNYTVEAVLNGCISAISGNYNFVGTGIGNLTLDGYKIYPNPSNGSFTVEFGYSGTDDINISIVNQSGAELYSTILKAQPFIRWDANLPGIFRAGVYYIKFTSNSKVLVQKMVVY